MWRYLVMSGVNNLKGSIVKDGKVIYSEKLENGFHFAIVLMYEPFYKGKNQANHQNSSQLYCEATITNGKRTEWSNGVVSIGDAEVCEVTLKSNKFEDISKDIKTKDGFRVWQKDYNYSEFVINVKGKPVKMKFRRLKWLVEVPKNDMFKYCKIS